MSRNIVNQTADFMFHVSATEWGHFNDSMLTIREAIPRLQIQRLREEKSHDYENLSAQT